MFRTLHNSKKKKAAGSALILLFVFLIFARDVRSHFPCFIYATRFTFHCSTYVLINQWIGKWPFSAISHPLEPCKLS